MIATIANSGVERKTLWEFANGVGKEYSQQLLLTLEKFVAQTHRQSDAHEYKGHKK